MRAKAGCRMRDFLDDSYNVPIVSRVRNSWAFAAERCDGSGFSKLATQRDDNGTLLGKIMHTLCSNV